MKQKICGLLAMLLLLSGCGSSTPADTSPMSEDEITQMYSDPDSFKGRTLELYGRVFNEPEYDDDGVYFQMWGDPENGERNTIVACKDTSLKLQDDDYVHISGSVSGKHEGENALGSKITAPAIVADSVEVVTYQEAWCADAVHRDGADSGADTVRLHGFGRLGGAGGKGNTRCGYGDEQRCSGVQYLRFQRKNRAERQAVRAGV